MKYNLKVKDKLNWVNHIVERLNTNDLLILHIDFNPKRLDIGDREEFILDENKRKYVLTFTADKDTLHTKNKNQDGEIKVDVNFYCMMFYNIDKYSTTLTLIRDSVLGAEKIIYKGK